MANREDCSAASMSVTGDVLHQARSRKIRRRALCERCAVRGSSWAAGVALDGGLDSVLLFQRRSFVHRDVLGFVALDLILWIISGRMMRIALIFDVIFVDLYDSAADMSRLSVPGHVIANFECFRHAGLVFLPQDRLSRCLNEASQPELAMPRRIEIKSH
jgi:hypothetical protein